MDRLFKIQGYVLANDIKDLYNKLAKRSLTHHNVAVEEVLSFSFSEAQKELMLWEDPDNSNIGTSLKTFLNNMKIPANQFYHNYLSQISVADFNQFLTFLREMGENPEKELYTLPHWKILHQAYCRSR